MATRLKEKEYKRINFFRGFVVKTDDWQTAEEYHFDRHQLHNAGFHGAGVVPGYRHRFRVRSRKRGDGSFEVMPGYAIDSEGRDIMLHETRIAHIRHKEFKLPLTVFFIVKYDEQPSDFVENPKNPALKGPSRILETCRFDTIITDPDLRDEIELFRVHLTADGTDISEPEDPDNPGPNEIDRRFIPIAGTSGGFIDSLLKYKLKIMMQKWLTFYGNLAKDRKLLSAHAVQFALMSMSMLMDTGQLGPGNIMGLLKNLADLKWDVIVEIEATRPSLKNKKEFAQLKRSVELFRARVAEGQLVDFTGEIDWSPLEQLLSYAETGAETFDKIGKTPKAEPEVDETIEKAMGEEWEKIKVFSKDFPKEWLIEDTKWILIDEIDILDQRSEQSHKFEILDANDSWRSRQRGRYPDGTVVQDAGTSHEGGYVTFVIKNVIPGRPLAIIRRMDFVRGDYELEYLIEDKPVGILECPGNDRKFRWRNWPFIVPSDFVKTEEIVIKQRPITAARDINMFHFWFYQPIG